MNEEETAPIEVVGEELPKLTGKALLDALFLKAAIGRMSLWARKPGGHHKARSQRAFHRIKARKQKRKAA